MKSTNISLKSASARPLGSQNRERSYRYRRLMQVSIRHTYYNASDKLCPDFAVVPTDASATLMASLGMLFRYEGSGFSVLVDEVHLKANFLKYQPAKLVSLLEAESMSGAPASPGDGACWARLSFMLTTNNPMFVNFTDMPIRSAASPATFYLSNIDAYTEKDGDTYLHKGPVRRRKFALTGSQYRVVLNTGSPPGSETRQVVARDISGEVVACEPAWWWRPANSSPPDSPAAIRAAMSPCCEDCPEPGDPAAVLRNPVYLGLGSLPEDKYRIEECAGEPGDCYSGPAQEVVYAWSVPSPMFFIDLLFTRPPGVTTGVYPVDLAEGTVTPTQYFLEFSHRSTTWNYYIVSTGKPLTDLQVETVAAPPGEPVSFIGPQSVTLTNQQKASRFVSDVSVPLQEQSDFNFQLKGKAGGLKPKGGVLVSRLPVASSLQVIPGVGDFATGGTEEEYSSPPGHHRNYSDIYVYI